MKKYVIPIIGIIIIIIGLIKVNIYNTAALSPLGNTENNYEIVSSEFGKDFSDFIKDKSPVKIYIGEVGDNEATVKAFGKNINLTKDNIFLRGLKPVISYIENTISSIGDKFNKSTDNNSEDVINKNIDDLNNTNNNSSSENANSTNDSNNQDSNNNTSTDENLNNTNDESNSSNTSSENANTNTNTNANSESTTNNKDNSSTQSNSTENKSELDKIIDNFINDQNNSNNN